MNISQTILKSKNEKAISLLDEWLEDTSGYDEKVWPKLKESIERNRLSERERFDDSSSDIGHGAAGEDHTPSP